MTWVMHLGWLLFLLVFVYLLLNLYLCHVCSISIYHRSRVAKKFQCASRRVWNSKCHTRPRNFPSRICLPSCLWGDLFYSCLFYMCLTIIIMLFMGIFFLQFMNKIGLMLPQKYSQLGYCAILTLIYIDFEIENYFFLS